MEQLEDLNLGQALYAIKDGKKVARDGWNGKGMFIYLVPAASYPIQRNINNTLSGIFPDDMAPYQSYIAMKTAQNLVTPWAPTQSDVLDEDWYIVE